MLSEPKQPQYPHQNEEALRRDEQYQQLQDLKDKLKSLDKVIREGEEVEAFKSSAFWPTFHRTLQTMRETYNADAHKASRDNRAEISHFLGREETIMDVLQIIEEFSTKADSAEAEKIVVSDQIQELNAILASPTGGDTIDTGGAMG